MIHRLLLSSNSSSSSLSPRFAASLVTRTTTTTTDNWFFISLPLHHLQHQHPDSFYHLNSRVQLYNHTICERRREASNQLIDRVKDNISPFSSLTSYQQHLTESHLLLLPLGKEPLDPKIAKSVALKQQEGVEKRVKCDKRSITHTRTPVAASSNISIRRRRRNNT